MAKKVYEEQNIKNIADAIRNKLKTQDTYKVNEMAAAIESIVGETSSDMYKVSSVEEMEKTDAKENDICLVYSNNVSSITTDSAFKNIFAEPTVILTQLPDPFSSVTFNSSAGDSLDFLFFLGTFYLDCTSKKTNKNISIEYAVETLEDGTIKCTRNCTDDLAQVEFLEDLTLSSKDTGDWEEWSLFFSTGSVNFEGIYTYTQNNGWEYLNVGLEANPSDILKDKKVYSNTGVITGEFGTMSTKKEYFDVNNMLLAAKAGSTPLTNIAYMFNDYKGTELPIVEYMNTQAVTNARGAFYNCINVKELNISDWETNNIQDASYLFCNCKNLNNLDLSNWNTDNVQWLNNCFYNCLNLKELNLSNWNLSNANDYINALFFNCKNLSNLNMFNWNICNTSILNNTFAYCENLKELNISNWNTNSLTKMISTFMRCNNITDLDLSDWNTNNITHWNSAFSYCNNLQNINIDMESAKYLDSAFSFCNSIKDFNFLSNIRDLNTACYTFKNSTINDFNNVFNTLIISQSNSLSNIMQCFENAKIDTTSLSYENLAFPNLTNGYRLLYGTNIENVYLNNISCPNATSLSYAVGNYKQIRDLCIQNIYAPNASIFNSSILNELKQNIVNIKFEDCEFGNKTWNNFTNAFRNSNAIFDFFWKNVQGINGNSMYLYNTFMNCPNLNNVYIDLNGGTIAGFSSIINSSNNVQDLTLENISYSITSPYVSSPFSGSTSLDNTNINLLNWIMKNNYTIRFDNVKAGGDWNLYNWNLSNVTESKNIFWNFNANTLELTDWDISNSTNFYSMFRNVQVNSLNISDWIVPQNKDYVSFSMMFYNCHSLNPQQIENWNLSGIKNINFYSMFEDAIDPYEEPETPLELEDWHFNLSNWNVQGEANLSSMFKGYSNRNMYINLTGWNPKLKGWLDNVFSHNNICQLDGIENWDTSNVTYMQTVFGDISKLEKLNLSQWNIENVEDIYYLTPLCQYLDVSNWRFSSFNGDYNRIFSPRSGNISNATLIADNWDFCDKEINNLGHVFDFNNINYLSLKNWKGLNNCNKFTYLVGEPVNTLDISNWNLSNTSDVTNAFYFLNNCQPNIIIDGFHIKEMKGISGMIPAPGSRGGAVIDEIDYSKAILEDNYFTTITETTNVNLDGIITNNITKIGLVRWRDQLILNNCDFSSVTNPGTWNAYSYYDNNGNKDIIGGFYNLGKGYTVQQEEYPEYTLNLPSKLSYNGLRNIAESIYNLYETYDVANGGTLYKQRIYCNTNLSYWSNMPADIQTMFAEKGWLFTYANQ